jgi:hypothetical protein
MCPLFGVEGSVDVCFSIAVLSESLLEMLDFCVKAFTVKNGLGLSDECRKNSIFL